jgi:hypothetical protein
MNKLCNTKKNNNVTSNLTQLNGNNQKRKNVRKMLVYGQFHEKWDKFVFSEIRNCASKVWRSYQLLSSVYKKVCYFFVFVVVKTRKPVLVELFLHYANLPPFFLKNCVKTPSLLISFFRNLNET